MSSSQNGAPMCFAFGDIRGDFSLLRCLLEEVMQVAVLDDATGEWLWTANQPTTVICLGDFLDRFSMDSSNGLLFNTAQAMLDQSRILHCFRSLIESAKRQPEQRFHFFVLAGDHEVNNLAGNKENRSCQMARPQEMEDEQLWRQFMIDEFIPFASSYLNVLIAWGTYYFAHAGLEAQWFRNVMTDFQSIPDLNRRFRGWIEQGKRTEFQCMLHPSSPVNTTKMSLQPGVWRQDDKETIQALLKNRYGPSVSFVLSGLPTQQIRIESYDVSMTGPQDDANDHQQHKPSVSRFTTNLLASRDDSDRDDMFFVNNAAADVFCKYPLDTRLPQALQLELQYRDVQMSSQRVGKQYLFTWSNVRTLDQRDYDAFNRRTHKRPCIVKYGRVLNTPTSSRGSTHDRGWLPETLDINRVKDEDANFFTDSIHQVRLVVLTPDAKQIFLERFGTDGKWELPGLNLKDFDQNVSTYPWQAVRTILPFPEPFFYPPHFVDSPVFHGTRLYRLRLKKFSESPHLEDLWTRNKQKENHGQWFALGDLIEAEHLAWDTQVQLCYLSRSNLLPDIPFCMAFQ